MLTELRITNFALIEEQVVHFEKGLNVICGQTGAGKSILLQSIEIILGARAKPGYLRQGAKAWEVEALFDLSELHANLRQALPDIVEGAQLLLSRSQSDTGKSKILINGRLGSLALLQEISAKLINLCRQGQSARLLEPAYHLELLDQYACNANLLLKYKEIYQAWKSAAKTLLDFEEAQKRAALRRAELEFIVSELRALNLTQNSRQDLEQQISKCNAAELILKGADELEHIFNSEQGLAAQHKRLASKLKEMGRFDTDLEALAQKALQLENDLDELWLAVSKSISSVELDQSALEGLRAKLSEVARLERKYQSNSEGLLQLLEHSEAELGSLEQASSKQQLVEAEMQMRTKMQELAQELSAKRRSASQKLIKTVESELAELSMRDAKLSVEFDQIEAGPNGMDKVHFLASTNKGERAQPLNQIASGGELSRIMLVLKKSLRDSSGVNILVFDEVDSGISGAVARAVGQKLSDLAKQSQVICITHLAQVASMADHLYRVEKISNKRTTSQVERIEGDQKIEEIAKMLAGYAVTPASRESARELLSSKNQ